MTNTACKAPTAFASSVQEAGFSITSDGLGMLVHQGADGFTLWTGQPISSEVHQATYTYLQSLYST